MTLDQMNRPARKRATRKRPSKTPRLINHSNTQRRYQQRRNDGLRSISFQELLDADHSFGVPKLFFDPGVVDDLLLELGRLQPHEADDERLVLKRLREAIEDKLITFRVYITTANNESSG